MIKFLDDGERDPQVGHVWNKEIQRTQQKTGYDGDEDILKNIYDLEGNNIEWTAQARDTGSRVGRGGYYFGVSDYSNFYPASYRGNCSPFYTVSNYSSRLGLFVNL